MTNQFKIKKLFWLTIPYFVSMAAAVGFYAGAQLLQDGISRDLLVNISADLASITFAFLAYQLLKSKSEKKLRRKITFYASNKVSTDIMSVLHTLAKLLYGFDEKRTIGETYKLRELSFKQIKSLISEKEVLGFQRFKVWDDSRINFSKILEDNFILKSLDDNQIEIIIDIVRDLLYLSFALNEEGNFIFSNTHSTKFEASLQDDKYGADKFIPTGKYLLLEKLKDHKAIVRDFGEFPLNMESNLLGVYKIKPEASDKVAATIYKVLSTLQKWNKLTS